MELLAPVRNLHLLYIHNTKITIVASSEKKCRSMSGFTSNGSQKIITSIEESPISK
jgi:hypothetical protein